MKHDYLPCLSYLIISNFEMMGLVYRMESNFKIGNKQPTFINCCGETWCWIGQINDIGEYLYKKFTKIKSLTIKL